MQSLSDPIVLAFIALAAVVGGIVAWFLKPRSPGTGPGFANDDDFVFKGNLVVYYKGTPDDPPKQSDYKKRPKKHIKVLYKEVDGSQWGSVTFYNQTSEEVIVGFPDASPFQASGPQDITLPAKTSQVHELVNDPGANNEDDYTFHVRIKKVGAAGYYDFDPGVKVRRG